MYLRILKTFLFVCYFSSKCSPLANKILVIVWKKRDEEVEQHFSGSFFILLLTEINSLWWDQSQCSINSFSKRKMRLLAALLWKSPVAAVQVGLVPIHVFPLLLGSVYPSTYVYLCSKWLWLRWPLILQNDFQCFPVCMCQEREIFSISPLKLILVS